MIADLRRVVAIGLFASIAACGGGAGAADDNRTAARVENAVAFPAASPANASKSAAGAAPDRAAVQPLIDRIYGPYVRGELEGTPDDVQTAGLRAAFARITEADELEADPYCECQDFEHFSYRIASIEPSASGAIVRVAISNFGESTTIVLHLAQEDGQWRVADVGEGDQSVLAMARHAGTGD